MEFELCFNQPVLLENGVSFAEGHQGQATKYAGAINKEFTEKGQLLHDNFLASGLPVEGVNT